jgi:hypothetical protein
MSLTFTSAMYWRERAEEARTKAEQMAESDARTAMLLAASNYAIMAERTEVLERLFTTPVRSLP